MWLTLHSEKWPLARNTDWSGCHRHTSLKFFLFAAHGCYDRATVYTRAYTYVIKNHTHVVFCLSLYIPKNIFCFCGVFPTQFPMYLVGSRNVFWTASACQRAQKTLLHFGNWEKCGLRVSRRFTNFSKDWAGDGIYCKLCMRNYLHVV